jgi:hypothetical protein
MHFLPRPPPDASLIERFGWVVKALVFRVQWLGMRQPAKEPVTEAIKGRLRRALDRFNALLARFEAGTLTPPKPRPARPRPEQADTGSPPPRPERVRLPRHFGWLREITGDIEITRLGENLDHMVRNDARMGALIEAAPWAGRLIRPILWMTGARQIPPILVPPDPDTMMQRWVAGDAAKRPPKPPPEPPPPFFAPLMPTPEQQEAEARRHASRPGGLFWDGKRFFYS